MPEGAGDDGSRPWQDAVDLAERRRVLEQILVKLVKILEGQPSPDDKLKSLASLFEHKMFSEAKSKEDYIQKIAYKLVVMERNRKPALQAASGPHQQIQTGCPAPLANTTEAIPGGSSSIAAAPKVASSLTSHTTQSSGLQSQPLTPPGSCIVPNQPMSHPVAPNVHNNVKQVQPDAMTKPDQTLNSSPTIVTQSDVHPSHLMTQPVACRNQNKLQVMQSRPVNISDGYPTSVAKSQGQLVVQPNGQQNTHRQNARGTGMLLLLQQQQLRINQQSLEVNQQQMNLQRRQMLVTQQANVANMAGHPVERNSQQNAGQKVKPPLKTCTPEVTRKHIRMEPQPEDLTQQLNTMNQQSSLVSAAPKTTASMGSAGEIDWREEMFQQMKALKDAYLSELVTLDQITVVPKLTKEEFEALSKDKNEQCKIILYMKKRIRTILNFLQLQKSNIPEDLRGQLPKFAKAIQNVIEFYRRRNDQRADMDKGRQSEISYKNPQIKNLTCNPPPSSGCSSSQQKQPEQTGAFHLTHNTATRIQAASQENHSSILLGVASSCVPIKPQGSVQSLPSNKFQSNRAQPSVTKTSHIKVASPSASAKSIFSSPAANPGAVGHASSSVSSPIAKPGLEVASPSASVKSTLPSPITNFGIMQAELPSASARSSSLPPFAKSHILGVASPTASVSTLPSPNKDVGVAQAASPCSPVKSAATSAPGANSGVVLVASPCASMKSTESDNVSALLQQNNAAVVVADGSTTKPLMPSSPLQAVTVGAQEEDLQHGGAAKPVTKTPINRLLDAVRSLSPEALKSSASLVCSVIRTNDWAPHGEFDTFCHSTLFPTQGGFSPSNNIKRIFEIEASSPEPSSLFDTWEVEFNAEHGAKRQKTQNARNALLEEIESANSMLMDTIIDIIDDNSICEGTLIKLCYTAVSLAPDLKSLFATSEMPIVMPVKLLVPADYPWSSPVLVNDQNGEQLKTMFSDVISSAADLTFRNTLYGIPEPRSIMETARAWDASVWRAVVEFAQQLGGGTVSSTFARWENCSGA